MRSETPSDCPASMTSAPECYDAIRRTPQLKRVEGEANTITRPNGADLAPETVYATAQEAALGDAHHLWDDGES